MDIDGKTTLITGANTGLGFEMALTLATRGAHVVVVGRDKDKVQNALRRIADETPGASLEAGICDLNSLASVAAFATDFIQRHDRLDILINNAGVMVPPKGKTADGFETQFGINFLAHFALTGHLFDLLVAASDARVVTMSSNAHKGAAIDIENFRLEKPYEQWREYGQSKLANLIFALELDRRLRHLDSSVLSLAAHPGATQTDLTRHIRNMPSDLEMMSPTDGAAPALVAATAQNVEGGQYWGPIGERELSGAPGLASVSEAARSSDVATRLWDWAEETTGLNYPK